MKWMLFSFFLLSLLDLFLVYTLPLNKAIVGNMAITGFLQTLLQIICVVGFYIATEQKKILILGTLFYLCNLEDIFFFSINYLLKGSLPLGELFWMGQYAIFGTWNLLHQCLWSSSILILGFLLLATFHEDTNTL